MVKLRKDFAVEIKTLAQDYETKLTQVHKVII